MHQGKSGFLGIPMTDCADANFTQEAYQHMQAELRQIKPEIMLATLYRRREAVSELIRLLERYERARARPIQKCTRRKPLAAA